MYNVISEKKQKLIDSMNLLPLSVGDPVTIMIDGSKTDVHVVNLEPLKVEINENRTKLHKVIKKSDIVSRPTYRLGANPFRHDDGMVRTVNFRY